MTSGTEIFSTRGFGEPGHSMVGNLSRLRQVSHAGMEADVALVDESHVWHRGDAVRRGGQHRGDAQQAGPLRCAWGCGIYLRASIQQLLFW